MIAKFADHYFEYYNDDSLFTWRHVKTEVTKGGAFRYAFVYEEQSGTWSDGYNAWNRKTTETLPDGNQNIVFTNYAGQLMLKSFQTPTASERWLYYQKFDEGDAEGQRTLFAHPSALESYNDASADLAVTYKTENQGLVEVSTYYSAPNAAKGYLHEEKVRKGNSAPGSDELLTTYTYGDYTPSGLTVAIHPVATVTKSGNTQTYDVSAASYFPGTYQQQRKTVTLPAISTGKNGSGVANQTTALLDAFGRMLWTKDERGVITKLVYDPATGARIQTIQDYDTTQSGSDAPAGWTTPTDPEGIVNYGQNLVSNTVVDLQGRSTERLGAVHEVDLNGTPTMVRTADWTLYREDIDEIWYSRGFVTGCPNDLAATVLGPVSITRMDDADRTIASIEASFAGTGKVTASAAFPQETWTRLSTSKYDNHSQLTQTRVYHCIPSSGDGVADCNYMETIFGYDSMGRQIRTLKPGGTIERTVRDTLGRAVSSWIGTDDTGATPADPDGDGSLPNNLVEVSTLIYDAGNNGGVSSSGGDGNVTLITLHQDSTTTRVTNFWYDYRNRRTKRLNPTSPKLESYFYDTQSNLTRTERWKLSDDNNPYWKSETKYDELFRPWEGREIPVVVSGGTERNPLITLTWYDPAGNVCKSSTPGNRAFTKFATDGVRQNVYTALAYDLDEDAYPYPLSVADDIVMEEVFSGYDPAGNNILQTSKKRFDSQPTGDGHLNGPSGAAPKSRNSYLASYADGIARPVAAANFGTNGGAPVTEASRPKTVPARSNDILVDTTFYNQAGLPFSSIDPMGTDNRQSYDDAARLVTTIENYVENQPSASDRNKTTRYGYAPTGQMCRLLCENEDTGNQLTEWIFGVSQEDGSDIASNDLLRSKVFPDPEGTGNTKIDYQQNRLAEIKASTDQLATVHSFDRDLSGRITVDRVALAAGSPVDDSVLRIQFSYSLRGLLTDVRSYDAPTGGSKVNDVELKYNDYLQLKEENTLFGDSDDDSFVRYSYEDGTNNSIRQTGTSYPSGHAFGIDYGAADSQDDILSRPASIVDDPSGTARHLADYTYMGLANLVSSLYGVPGAKMTLIAQSGEPQSGPAGDKYTGLDRFGRLVDKRWIKTGTSDPIVDLVRAQYTYDRAGNRLTHTNPVATAAGVNLDQSYGYDGLYQVASHQTGIGTGIPATEEQFTYDPTGNWNRYKALAAGTVTEDTPRTNNSANQITQIDGTPELIAHNATGNTTRIPKPADPTKSFDLKWDAWNRLVKVSDSETGDVVAVYTYDGLTRRISTDDGTGTDTRRFYYNQQWRCVEEFNGGDFEDRKLLKRYFWGAQNRWELIARQRDTDGNGTLDEELFVLTDAMDPVAILTANGSIQERYSYSAFGEASILNPAFADKATGTEFGWGMLFHVELKDDSTGLYNYGYRFYLTSLGKWISRDPIEESDGCHLYCYVANNPVITQDYLGLKELHCECDGKTFSKKPTKEEICGCLEMKAIIRRTWRAWLGRPIVVDENLDGKIPEQKRKSDISAWIKVSFKDGCPCCCHEKLYQESNGDNNSRVRMKMEYKNPKGDWIVKNINNTPEFGPTAPVLGYLDGRAIMAGCGRRWLTMYDVHGVPGQKLRVTIKVDTDDCLQEEWDIVDQKEVK